MFISEVYKGGTDGRGTLETKVYKELEKLNIPFERVDNDSVKTMEECVEINNILGAEIRKTIVLCNRKKTSFFLIVMPAFKALDTKEVGKIIGVSGLSFAPADKMQEILGAEPGDATVMGILNDVDDYVQVLVDKEVAEEEFFACNPGVNTSHIKFKTSDLLNVFLPKNHHKATIIELSGE